MSTIETIDPNVQQAAQFFHDLVGLLADRSRPLNDPELRSAKLDEARSHIKSLAEQGVRMPEGQLKADYEIHTEKWLGTTDKSGRQSEDNVSHISVSYGENGFSTNFLPAKSRMVIDVCDENFSPSLRVFESTSGKFGYQQISNNVAQSPQVCDDDSFLRILSNKIGVPHLYKAEDRDKPSSFVNVTRLTSAA